jgi:hypothetical protein
MGAGESAVSACQTRLSAVGNGDAIGLVARACAYALENPSMFGVRPHASLADRHRIAGFVLLDLVSEKFMQGLYGITIS